MLGLFARPLDGGLSRCVQYSREEVIPRSCLKLRNGSRRACTRPSLSFAPRSLTADRQIRSAVANGRPAALLEVGCPLLQAGGALRPLFFAPHSLTADRQLRSADANGRPVGLLEVGYPLLLADGLLARGDD